MKKLIILAALTLISAASKAAPPQPNMFFYCKGHHGEVSLQVSSKKYFQGQIQGLQFEVRGIYNNYHDEVFETLQPIVKQANYNPRNPVLKGLDKYVVESKDYTTLAIMIPSRQDLEKQWDDGSQRNKSNHFKGYAQMQYSSGDDFVSIVLDCNLNWKPTR